jgi:fructose-1,6-bisphosphatase/inositol monophosphatase family enzyme
MLDLSEYLAFAESLAKEAGEIARQHFTHDIAFESKDDSSPVTAADLEINALVIKRCREAYPDIGIIGEEESDNPVPGKLVWVCDPIDGTIPYSLGMYISTFCLALVRDGEPVVGVVYDFGKDRMFSAIKGDSATVNGKPIPKPTRDPMKLINLEWWGAGKFDLRGLREHLFAKGFQVPNYASSSYLSMMVAVGRTTGVIYSGNMPWDIAAAKVIVEACGGKVTDLYGDRQRYDRPIRGAIVAHPDNFEQLQHAVTETLIHGQ